MECSIWRVIMTDQEQEEREEREEVEEGDKDGLTFTEVPGPGIPPKYSAPPWRLPDSQHRLRSPPVGRGGQSQSLGKISTVVTGRLKNRKFTDEF